MRQLVERERGVRSFFRLECPSDWGWSEEVYGGLVRAVETDFELRVDMADQLGGMLKVESRPENDIRCPADMPRYEAWMFDQVLREWEAELLDPPDDMHSFNEAVAPAILDDLAYSDHPGVGDLLRGIARDAEVFKYNRADALESWRVRHMRTTGASDTAAYKAVLLDMVTAAPVPDWEDWAMEVVVKAEGDDFRCEYKQALEAAGPRPAAGPPPNPQTRIRIGRAVAPPPDPCEGRV